MTKDKALHKYFENYMMNAFPDAPVRDDDYFYTYLKELVPRDAILPYMTYEYVDNSFLDGDVYISAELWNRTEDVALMNEKVRELRLYIEANDMIRCDEGYIWIKPGSPFGQTIPVENSEGLIGKTINIAIEYFTA